MATKINEDGSITVKVKSGSYTFRVPRGRDLMAIEQATKQQDATNISLANASMTTLYVADAGGAAAVDFLDLPADEFLEVYKGISTFPCFSPSNNA